MTAVPERLQHNQQKHFLLNTCAKRLKRKSVWVEGAKDEGLKAKGEKEK